MPFITTPSGAAGSVSSFAVRSSPRAASSSTKSVKVPPMSMPRSFMPPGSCEAVALAHARQLVAGERGVEALAAAFDADRLQVHHRFGNLERRAGRVEDRNPVDLAASGGHEDHVEDVAGRDEHARAILDGLAPDLPDRLDDRAGTADAGGQVPRSHVHDGIARHEALAE